jgi:hypothetical protein
MQYTYNHHRCRDVCLAVPHSAELLQHVHQGGIVLRRIVYERREADGAVFAFDVEIVLQRDRQAMERSNDLPCAIEMVIEGFGGFDRLVEERVAKAVQLILH